MDLVEIFRRIREDDAWNGIRIWGELEGIDVDCSFVKEILQVYEGSDVFCQETRQAIRTFVEEGGQDRALVLEALARDLKADKVVLGLEQHEAGDGKMKLQSLEDEAGNHWLTLLPSPAWIPRGYGVINSHLYDILLSAVHERVWYGVTLNVGNGDFRLELPDMMHLLKGLRNRPENVAVQPGDLEEFCLNTERAIQGVRQRKDKTAFEIIREALRQDLKLDSWLEVPIVYDVDPKDPGNEHFCFLFVWDDSGREWLPVFTSDPMRPPDDFKDALPFPLREICSTGTSDKEGCGRGVCFNPNCDGGVRIPWESIQNLLELEERIPQDEQDLRDGRKAFAAGDFEEARRCFHRSIAALNPRAFDWLGLCCYEGLGGPVDRDKASSLWVRAALMGDGYALCRLGDLFCNGGLPRDVAFAYVLYNRAFDREKEEKDPFGYPDACLRLLRHCGKELTPARRRFLAREAVEGFRQRLDQGEADISALYKEARAFLKAAESALEEN